MKNIGKIGKFVNKVTGSMFSAAQSRTLAFLFLTDVVITKGFF